MAVGEYTESRFAADSVQAQSRPANPVESNVTPGFLGLASQDPDSKLTSSALGS